MDVEARDSTAAAGRPPSAFGFDRLAQLLGGWQATELRAARGFPECRGLSQAQLEDLYQDTALALLSRPYASEEHLRNALRHGIRHRALNLHRDQRRRREILAEHAPAMHRQAAAGQTQPEDAALAAQDRLIAKEFLSELDPLERQVFALSAEGLKYRAIASALSIPPNEARTATRSAERKRARFQLLYETGRLCGYRAATIDALEEGAGSGVAAKQARAHLAACQTCRARSAPASRGRTGAAWSLGAPVVAGLAILWGWARRVAGTGGVTAKATAAVITAAVVAGGTLGPSAHQNLRPARPHPGRAVPGAPRATTNGAHPHSGPGKASRPAMSVVRPSRASTRVRARAHPVGPPGPPWAGSSPAEGTTAEVNVAQREFGLER